jgi:hypothetical protein
MYRKSRMAQTAQIPWADENPTWLEIGILMMTPSSILHISQCSLPETQESDVIPFEINVGCDSVEVGYSDYQLHLCQICLSAI